MSNVDSIIKAVKEYVNRLIIAKTPQAYFGTWIATESVDADLSQVTVGGVTLRYVPKLESVTGLSAGDKVLIVKYAGMPAIIHGVPLGDVTKAV